MHEPPARAAPAASRQMPEPPMPPIARGSDAIAMTGMTARSDDRLAPLLARAVFERAGRSATPMLARVSKRMSANLDGQTQNWGALLTTYRAAGPPGPGGPPPGSAAPDLTTVATLQEPTTRAAWIAAWKRIWEIVAQFKAEVTAQEEKERVANQQVSQAQKKSKVDTPQALAAQERKTAAVLRLAQIRTDAPLVTMQVCGHTVRVDRGLPESKGAKTAGWVAIDALTPADMKYTALAAKLTDEQKVLADTKHNGDRQAALTAQTTRIKQIVDGSRPAGATAAEASIATVWFGPESMRNADSFGMGLMLLDLMATGATYGNSKSYTWLNVLTGATRDDESLEAWSQRKNQPATLSGRAIDSLDLWSGKFPMAPKGSEELGAAALGAKPNVVQAKEASLLANWIRARGITTAEGLREQLTAL